MKPGTADLFRTLTMMRLVLFMAWSDVRARYKRSVLGPLWITLGTAIGVVGLGFVWSELFHMDRGTFIPLLTLGLILWQYISGSIMESTRVFTLQVSLIRNLDLPISFHPAQLLLRQMINFAHTIPLFIVVFLILGKPFALVNLLAIPAFVLVSLNLFWIILMFGILGARFRDLEYLVNMIMPLLMFLSPVMFRPNALPFSGELLLLNPMTYLIEIVRQPLLGEMPTLSIVTGNLVLLVIGGGLSLALFNKKRDRVALWV